MADYIGITKPLAVVGVTPKPEINYFYGPWESINEVLNTIPQLARIKGLTVGIIEGSEIVEYWFKDGVDLVLKSVDPELVYTIDETQQIINGLENTYVAKEEGKSLIEDTKIAKLDALPSSVYSQAESQQIIDDLDTKINAKVTAVPDQRLITEQEADKLASAVTPQELSAVDIGLQGQIDTHTSQINIHSSQIQDIVSTYINNKGYFATLTSLQASHPTPEIGDTAYVADALSSTGYYIYNVVDGVWTSSTAEAPPVTVPINDYALNGGSSKTLKEVDDDLAQLAGDLNTYGVLGIEGINKLNPKNYLQDRYISSNGLVQVSPGWKTSDYQNIYDAVSFRRDVQTPFAIAYIAQYDSNKIFITGSYQTNVSTINKINDSAFYRISTTVDFDKVMAVDGAIEGIAFEKYTLLVEKNKEGNNAVFKPNIEDIELKSLLNSIDLKTLDENAKLRLWLLGECFVIDSNATYNPDGSLKSANVIYPDLKTGSITINRNLSGAAISMVASYNGKNATYTINRDSGNKVINTSITIS